MQLTISKNELISFLKHFFTLTGIRIVIFDLQFNELISYPEKFSAICERLKASPEGRKRCRACDLHAQNEIQNSKEPYLIYTCHAGLIDSIAPILQDNKIVGYMMCGQCAPSAISIDDAWAAAVSRCSSYLDIRDLKDTFYALPRPTHEQLHASVQIMTACALYIVSKNLINAKQNEQLISIQTYIQENLADDLSAQTICEKLLIPRNQLFKMIKNETGQTLGQYIRTMRLEYAKSLLASTQYPIAKIAEMCGINDYNYFSRIFKNHFKISPSQFVAQHAPKP